MSSNLGLMVLALGDVKLIGDQLEGEALIEAARLLDDERFKNYLKLMMNEKIATAVLASAITDLAEMERDKAPL